MWGLEKQQRYWLWSGATDMRRGFDGLSGMIRKGMSVRDPLSGDAFIFVNSRRTQMKILVWESGGFLIYHKRLESGTYERPVVDASGSLRWDALICWWKGLFWRVFSGANGSVFRRKKGHNYLFFFDKKESIMLGGVVRNVVSC
jgi:transposase